MNRLDEAVRETNLAITLRPNEATVLYNAACAFCLMKRKPEALEALRKPGKPVSRTRIGRAVILTSLSTR